MHGNWIQTYTNKKFWPLDPRPEDVSIIDIAMSLSNKCRFTGHTKGFYSVAQHSVLVSRYCNQEDAFWGLMHDASEAYLADLAKPIKILPEFKFFVEIENKIQEAICKHFGMSIGEPPSVKKADKRLLLTEKRDLMGFIPLNEWQIRFEEVEIDEKIQPLLPELAFQQFIARFLELAPKEHLVELNANTTNHNSHNRFYF